ncbi:MAG: RusA family crossover junction endodeoxyribonuclease [Solirubrobacterales bacterium]
MKPYAKVVIQGSPITKSNFKLSNLKGRAILPYNSGKYHDRYAIYEEEIAYQARMQNPGVVLQESLIAVLKVFYKSSKRHPDTTNITKSIFDGIEKSGLIINDAQVRRLIIEEYYDVVTPRFELELFGESSFSMFYTINENADAKSPVNYNPPPNKKKLGNIMPKDPVKDSKRCEICNKLVSEKEKISANNGKTIICRDCLKKLF